IGPNLHSVSEKPQNSQAQQAVNRLAGQRRQPAAVRRAALSERYALTGLPFHLGRKMAQSSQWARPLLKVLVWLWGHEPPVTCHREKTAFSPGGAGLVGWGSSAGGASG